MQQSPWQILWEKQIYLLHVYRRGCFDIRCASESSGKLFATKITSVFNDPEAHQLLSSIICFFQAEQDMTV